MYCTESDVEIDSQTQISQYKIYLNLDLLYYKNIFQMSQVT